VRALRGGEIHAAESAALERVKRWFLRCNLMGDLGPRDYEKVKHLIDSHERGSKVLLSSVS
jgi:hypothetical protein